MKDLRPDLKPQPEGLMKAAVLLRRVLQTADEAGMKEQREKKREDHWREQQQRQRKERQQAGWTRQKREITYWQAHCST